MQLKKDTLSHNWSKASSAETFRDENLLPDPSKQKQTKVRFLVSRSPLARKIVLFNLLALVVLVVGVMLLHPVRQNLSQQAADGLLFQTEVITDLIETKLGNSPSDIDWNSTDHDIRSALVGLKPSSAIDVYLYTTDGRLILKVNGEDRVRIPLDDAQFRSPEATVIMKGVDAFWDRLSGFLGLARHVHSDVAAEAFANAIVKEGPLSSVRIEALEVAGEQTHIVAVSPMTLMGRLEGVVVLTQSTEDIEDILRREREHIFQIFLISIVVSVGVSLVLASTIANPISELATAAELGRDGNNRKSAPARVRIPDLTSRQDEIGRLSGAMRSLVAALYDRMDANERFAADVSHELKNPLASLRSAVGTLEMATKNSEKKTLMDIIDHDLRRLDRLVTDISNASRLDNELAKEDEDEFDLVITLNNLSAHFADEAEQLSIQFITDLPDYPILLHGLEGRLAQVFVNLVTNALSFCEVGDAIRIWARKRENRVLIVVEDTGPGIPATSLKKIFTRFYSERPEGQFGNNSGLGLAISKQIVEAHGGVIWAENILPTEMDATSDPLGARFVVGLPL